MIKKRVLIIDSSVESHFETIEVESRILKDVEIEHIQISSLDELNKESLGEVDALIVWSCLPSIYFDDQFLSQLKSCKIIVKAAVGYDNIDIDAARRLGIVVCNTPDYGTDEVADHSMALILALVRNLNNTHNHVKEGGWDWKSMGSTIRLKGSKLGIIGFGRIGIALARRAKSFGLSVCFYDPFIPNGIDKSCDVERYENLEDLLSQSDIISINCSLTEQSEHLLGEEQFSKMKPGAIVVNTSRGGVIQNDALIDAIQTGIISGAGLDVIETEPEIPNKLKGFDNVILTPHSAFYSDLSFHEMRTKSSSMVKNYFELGQIKNLVNGKTALA